MLLKNCLEPVSNQVNVTANQVNVNEKCINVCCLQKIRKFLKFVFQPLTISKEK